MRTFQKDSLGLVWQVVHGARALAGPMAVAWLLAMAAPVAKSVTIDMVTVGNPGNAPDPATGGLYGAVNYEYRIGKYEVTIGQFTEYLNATLKSDPNRVWNLAWTSGLYTAGISRSGSAGAYFYTPIAPAGLKPPGADSATDRPMSMVSWIDTVRFVNWMSNGQGDGSTESGAYTISKGQITGAIRAGGIVTYSVATPTTLSVGDQVTVAGSLAGIGIVETVTGSTFTMRSSNPNSVFTGTAAYVGVSQTAAATALYCLPTENEWYKAAYYSPSRNGGTGGYYTYATQSDSSPGNEITDGSNQANIWDGDWSVTQSTAPPDRSQNYLTNVGAFGNSRSFYGTFDQTGNLSEWIETVGSGSGGFVGSMRVKRGGNWASTYGDSSSSWRIEDNPNNRNNNGSIQGFRLASRASSPSPIPEIDPAGLGSVLALVTGALGLLERRRKQAA